MAFKSSSKQGKWFCGSHKTVSLKKVNIYFLHSYTPKGAGSQVTHILNLLLASLHALPQHMNTPKELVKQAHKIRPSTVTGKAHGHQPSPPFCAATNCDTKHYLKIITHVTFFGAFATLRKVTISFVMCVRLSSWNKSASTGRIFIKFDILAFRKSVYKIQF